MAGADTSASMTALLPEQATLCARKCGAGLYQYRRRCQAGPAQRWSFMHEKMSSIRTVYQKRGEAHQLMRQSLRLMLPLRQQ